MPDVNLFADFTDPGGTRVAVAAKVYARLRWGDDWELQPHVYCNHAVWTLAPGMGSAELQWRYGPIKQADEMTFRLFGPDPGFRRYIKIVWENATYEIGGKTIPLVWYGIVNGVAAKAGGVRSFDGLPVETGMQSLQCVGLEKMLEDTVIKNSTWGNLDEFHNIDRGLTFNADRADGTQGGNMAFSGVGVPLFASTVRDDFEFWTTPYALKYLLFFHRPKDAAGASLPFVIDDFYFDLVNLTHDRPQIHLHGRTVREVINQLLPHQRFLSWYLDVDEDDNSIVLVVVSLTGDDIDLPSGDSLKANPYRWGLGVDSSRSDVVLTLSHAESVDRCRVQGALATSTFTISYEDGTLEAAYNSTTKTAYDTGATGSAAFTAAGTSIDIKRKLHHEFRAKEHVRMAYSLYGIISTFDGRVGDGIGGAKNHFCPIDTETASFQFYNRELFIESHLALRDGYDYTTLVDESQNPTAPTKVTVGPFNNLPPIVVIQIPATGLDATALAATKRWVPFDRLGMASIIETVPGDADRGWSGHVHVPRKDRRLHLTVTGKPQHIIAGADYTKKTEEEILNVWDWKTIIATVTCKWDAYCEGVWPERADLPDQDHIREAVFQAGDEYRLDWLVQNTVIGLTDTGLKRCVAGGWIKDDRAKLLDRAKLAFAWYGIERRAVQVPTSKINGSIKLGDFVSQVGDAIAHTVNTVVTSMRVDCPPGEAIPMLSYTTDYIPDLDLFLSPSLDKSVPKAPPAPRIGGPVGLKDVSGQMWGEMFKDIMSRNPFDNYPAK
jgi:hypothetical protein